MEEMNATEVAAQYAEKLGALRERLRQLDEFAATTNDADKLREAIRATFEAAR